MSDPSTDLIHRVGWEISNAVVDEMRAQGFSGGWDSDALANTIASAAVRVSGAELISELQGISSSLGAGGVEETDFGKLMERIRWGVDHIQQVEAKRAADLVEELSQSPKTTWGQVKQALLARAQVSA